MELQNNSYTQLSKLHVVCLKQNIPFVSYRLPLESELITLVQYQSVPEKLDSLDSIQAKSGFIVAPFAVSESHQTYFLAPDCVFFSNEIEDVFIHKLATNSQFLSCKCNPKVNVQTTTSDEFIANVNTALEAMDNGVFQKVVLSKVRVENIDEDFHPETLFLKLCNKYPHAMVYLMQLPGVGCWMGATPEPLLVIENERVKTVSLAGTQMASGLEIDEYQWSEKEIEEQEIVTSFVEQTLQLLEIKNLNKIGPVNYQAANLIHLKTGFEFGQNDSKFQLGKFIQALHPTPSVGGLPKNEARDFILANELHDRSYYTGFLGPVNINKKSNIFVNLRCLQLLGQQFVLYSGAGITTSSLAEREWEETDNKMLTMMNAMKTPNN